ncbi:MAG: hypothetical protein L0Y61_09180, partial [Epsilonproteobacteria bacterium]|nr:hypothetical protein [Campylobacterota bacterium]
AVKTDKRVKVTLKGIELFESISGRRLPIVPSEKIKKAPLEETCPVVSRAVEETPENVAPTTM